MKRTARILKSVGMGLVVAACGHHEVGPTTITSAPMDASSKAQASAADRAREDAQRAAQEANPRAATERAASAALDAELTARREHEEFARAAWTRLEFLEDRIRSLEARAPRLPPPRRARLVRELAALRKTHDALDHAIHRLPDLSGADWDAERRTIEAQLEEAERTAVEAAWSSEP
jgi:hypothetical protein